MTSGDGAGGAVVVDVAHDARVRKAVDDGLDAHNRAAAPLDAVHALSVVARDGDRVVGGANGRTWGACAELQQLWVDDARRRLGIGASVLRRFEHEAAARGCKLVYLETFTFQAPAFYLAQGYSTALRIDGYPDGIAKLTMQKRLDR